MKFKIGEFSKLCQVTVKTLRYYEKIGLLTPIEVDECTGYRYYDISQLRLMSKIVQLKQLGFYLEEILDIFDAETQMPSVEMIRMKAQQCGEDIERLTKRQSDLEKLETIILKTKNIMEKVFVKSLPSRIFATHRSKIGSYQELFNLCPNVIGKEMARLGCQCLAPEYCFTVEYQKEYGVDIDIEYFEAVVERKQDSELIKFKELPEVPKALCIKHKGSYEMMPETFAELYSYVEAHGYEPSEPARFVYIDGVWNKESVDEWMTEIQLPVKK